MTPDPKEVLKLAASIVAAEEKLAALKQEWENLFHPKTISITPNLRIAESIVRRNRSASPNSLPSKIMGLLQSSSNPVDIGTLAALTGETALAVSRSLSRMGAQGKVKNVSRGMWQLIGTPPSANEDVDIFGALGGGINDQGVAEATQ